MNTAATKNYDNVIPGPLGWTRTHSKSTPLFGGAFKARGDGALANPDMLSQAWTPSGSYAKHCNKRLSEVMYDTWACQTAPNAPEVEFHPRGGISARMGLQYIGGC